MGKSAPLEAELRRWSLKGHSRCLLPGYLPAQAADLPGKTLGTLAKSSCANVKLQNDPAALPFSPTPPTSGSCGEAEMPTFAVLWVSGSTGLESPPHPMWETYSHLVVIVLRTGRRKKKQPERKNKQLSPHTPPPPHPTPRLACQTLRSV